jgi:hypothetical protein
MRHTFRTTLARYLVGGLAPLALLMGCPANVIEFRYEALPASTGTGSTSGAPLCSPGATASCYDGPSGTEGVGICKGGIETCATDGSGWGPCVGEVLPQTGNCASGMDGACNGGPAVCKGTTLWAERFGDGADQQGNGIAADAAGNVLVTGWVGGSANFGKENLTAAGAHDVFVAKLDPSGAYIWAHLFGDANNQEGNSVALDAAGNVLVTGVVAGTIDFGQGPQSCPMGDCIFVAKLGPTGAPLWGKVFGQTGHGAGAAIAADGKGNVFVTGSVNGAVDFGGGALVSAGGDDIFVLALDPSGAFAWAKLFGDASGQKGSSVAVDAAGDLFVTGSAAGTVNFGAGGLISEGATSIFVAKFDPTGAPLWSKLFGAGGNPGNVGTGIAADASGNAVVTGWVSGSADFGGGSLTSAGAIDIFVAKFDPDGAPIWSHLFGGPGSQLGWSLAVDPASNVVVTGYFSGAVDFGGGTGEIVSAGLDDIFVAKFKPDGTALWSKRFGDPGSQAGFGVATDASSNVCVTGKMLGTVDFGIPPPLASMGGEDIFVTKLSP